MLFSSQFGREEDVNLTCSLETVIKMTWWVARRYYGHGLDNMTTNDLKTTLATNSFTNPLLVNGFVLVH